MESKKYISKIEIMVPVEQTCENCRKWYRNDNNGKECIWNNNEVPRKNDYCSRWEQNE